MSSNARTLADLVSNGNELADGQISVSEISDLTASAAELNTLDGITADVNELNILDGVTASTAELNFMDGATSSIQDQLDNISVTSGSLTKSFANGETASITLSGAISPAPVVSVTKEVAQTGVSSKGGWDVATDGSNYELHDTAYDTTLTLGSIPFSIKNASYNSVSFDVSSQDTDPETITFNNDGTKMYIGGATNDSIYQYTLSTAFDVSTASYDSVSLDVTSQESSGPNGITFNDDGTKLYMVGNAVDRVHEYALATAFDLSTASFTTNFAVGGQDTFPEDIAFNSDGTKMYILGATGDDVNQYTLATAFDISSASFDSVTFSVASQETNPSGLAFNASGTKMFIVGNVSDSVHQYTLATAFDVSTASYDSVSFDVSSEETGPQGIAFNNDGTKMYIVGTISDTVYQYSTSEGLVLGSGSFASTDVGKRIVGNGGEAILTATDGSYSVVTAFDDSSTIASGDWSMFALTFDGTDGVAVNTLEDTYNIANASYDSKSFSFASQSEGFPHEVVFNSDGTKMYMIGTDQDTIFQYALSTAFDVSTAAYDFVTFSVTSNQTLPFGLAFNNDGTKMYIIGTTDDDIDEYALSTAFHVSSASRVGGFSVSSQDNAPSGMTFNNDGTKLYIIGQQNDRVHQYTLSTAFDVTSASYDSVSFDVSSQEGTPTSVRFNSDGTKMFIVGQTNDTVYQYSLSTAYDVSTAFYNNVSFSVASQENAPTGVTFNNDGTKMYIVGVTNDSVFQYSTGNGNSAPTSAYHPTVTKASGQISTEYWTDINTMTADETLNGGEVYYAVSTDDRTTWAVIDDTDGVRPIVRNNSGTWEYNDASTYDGETWTSASTNEELYALQEALEDEVAEEVIGFDLNVASYDSVSFSVASQDTLIEGLTFNSDGTKMYVVGSSGDEVNQYTLSTAFDVSTASHDTQFSVSSQDTSPRDVAFNNDGTKMYIVGAKGDDVNQYTLATGFDLSTASFDSVTFSVASQEVNPEGIFFNNDGTKMFIVGVSGQDVNQYTLSTGFDLSTASFDSVTFSVASEDLSPEGITFNSDGTKMYITGFSDSVHQYTLSTAFDLSTASYDSVAFDVSSQETSPKGIVFNSDGTKMYVVGYNTNTVYQYTTGSTTQLNRMNSTQLNAVTDPNHYTLGDTLDLAIMLYTDSAGSIPESDGVSINYDAEALNQGAVVGTDYDFDFPDSTTVRITSNAAQNLKVRVV